MIDDFPLLHHQSCILHLFRIMQQRENTMVWRISIVACVISVACLGAATASAGQWYVTDLGAGFVPTAINASGTIVGLDGYTIGSATDSYVRAEYGIGVGGAMWSNHVKATLPLCNGTAITPYGINSSGTIVGSGNGGPAAVYSNGSWDVIPTPAITATAINDSGVIVGRSTTNAAYMLTGGAYGTLTTIAANGTAYAISNDGVIVGGEGFGMAQSVYPWYYSNGVVTGLFNEWLQDHGALTCVGPGPAYNAVMGGVLVQNMGYPRSAIYLPGQTAAIDQNWHHTSGVFGQWHSYWEGVWGVDSLGNMVGQIGAINTAYYDGISLPKDDYAFLYTNAAGYYSSPSTDNVINLNSLIPSTAGWTLQMSRAINVVNVAGHVGEEWIVGWGTYNGVQHGYLLTPTSYAAAFMPGDANGDGTVNINDLSKVLTNYDKTGMQWADGDFNGDGTVNISDLSNVLTNYDKTAAAGASLAAVPEPSVLAMLAAGLLALLACARRR
jgi:hypothetical protein